MSGASFPWTSPPATPQEPSGKALTERARRAAGRAKAQADRPALERTWAAIEASLKRRQPR